MYVHETWALTQPNDIQLCTFEREISRKVYDPVQDREWKAKYNQELYQLYRFRPDPARELSANLYDIYQCCVYSEKLLMMYRGTVRNM